jgi:hypothetical protein
MVRFLSFLFVVCSLGADLSASETFELDCIAKFVDHTDEKELKEVLDLNNLACSAFYSAGVVDAEIIGSCLGALSYCYRKFYLSGSLEGMNKSEKCDESFLPYIDSLKVRLFDLCVAYYRSAGESSGEFQANGLCESLITFARSKAREVN